MSVATQVVPAKRPGRKPKRAEPVTVTVSEEEIEDDEDEEESENIQVLLHVKAQHISIYNLFSFTC